MSDPSTVLDVLARVAPEHQTFTVCDGEPVFGVTIEGAADFVLSHAGHRIGVAGVLAILADTTPAGLYGELIAELERRGEVIADATR